MKNYDLCIIGGGIVGLAIAFGEVQRGKSVVVLDGERSDRKASFANFGLVWAQGKGRGMPAYQALTQRSTDAWLDFTGLVEDASGMTLQYERNGGLVFCLSEEEFDARQRHLTALQLTSGFATDWEMLGRNETQMRLGDISLGREVVGASYCYRDGAVNPLHLVRSLSVAIEKLGGKLKREAFVQTLQQQTGSWIIKTATESIQAETVVVAAGLGSKKIAADLGVDLPIAADKGQILVSERRPQAMQLPASGLRQTQTGSFMIGATHEGDLDRRSTISSGAKLARRAVRTLPELEHVPIVRQWAGHRIVTPDTYPVYMQPLEGLIFAACHSGITLAAFHSSNWLEDPKVFESFSVERFVGKDKEKTAVTA
ncbi:FAD-binding oxidoreductase [uncultured Roseobacter sp.]|uniref:NAD(P)/FAD-dependent oxidoreductase n=1 Tax=uncultured Roseobacter sp. TaxID=114847 RepID=UPI002621FF05|nr:FAD-dependent oxidoreductase [uncultured Roseobacter sp.]